MTTRTYYWHGSSSAVYPEDMSCRRPRGRVLKCDLVRAATRAEAARLMAGRLEAQMRDDEEVGR